MSSRPLLGHTAVVAHGASGVGLQIARHLAAAGADIVLLDADPDVGHVASRLRSDLGMPAMGARGDLGDPAFMSTAFRAAVEHLDFPDVLVLAAPEGAEVAVAAFDARLDAAGKTGVCVAVVEGTPAPERVDGRIRHCELGVDDPQLVDAALSCCAPVRPSSSA